MTLIPYEEFNIDLATLDKLNEHYKNRKIEEYLETNGTLPSSGIVESFVIPSSLMERYKRYYYSQYYQKEVEFEKEFGPSETIETSFDFSTVEDSGSTVLGATRSGESGDSEEYQYEYWSIVVLDLTMNSVCNLGTFTTLSNVSISLNSLKKYAFAIYHRKSNHLYGAIKPIWPQMNKFDMNGGVNTGIISSYSDLWVLRTDGDGCDVVEYDTQMDDKEYIGTIAEYTPYDGGIVSGSVYTLNPRKRIVVSGLTSGLTLSVTFGRTFGRTLQFFYNQDGQLTTSGDLSKLTILSDTSFSYLMTKDELINEVPESALYRVEANHHIEIKNIENPQYAYPSGNYSCSKANGQSAIGVTTEGNFTICRNDTSEIIINIPPQGEDIDTGFDFDVIDD